MSAITSGHMAMITIPIATPTRMMTGIGAAADFDSAKHRVERGFSLLGPGLWNADASAEVQ
jgi:hypothetical protein